MSDSLWPHGLQHTKLPCPSPSPRVCSNSCPLSGWCHPTTPFSAALFSFCLQSFQELGDTELKSQVNPIRNTTDIQEFPQNSVLPFHSSVTGCSFTYHPLKALILLVATRCSFLKKYFICRLPSLSCGLQNFSWHVGSKSLTRDQTQAPCIGSMGSEPLDHQGRPFTM